MLAQSLDRREDIANLRPSRSLLWRKTMAKSSTVLIKLVSTADTGYYYVTKKNPRAKTEKIELKKYDPVDRKHVAIQESKIK